VLGTRDDRFGTPQRGFPLNGSVGSPLRRLEQPVEQSRFDRVERVADRAEHDYACAERGEFEPWRQPNHVLELAFVFSAGPHPVREAIAFGNFQTALAAFCEVLA
jgi:hypothetical protein